MIDHKIDEQLQRFSSAVAHASPDPLLLSEPSSGQRYTRPAFAIASAFAVVMLTVGLGALAVTWTRSLDNTQESGTNNELLDRDIEAYWEWLTADAVALEPGVVGVTQTGPTPSFDPSTLGEVQRLVSYAESPQGLYTPDYEPLFIPPVAHIGTIEGATTQVQTQVQLYRTLDPFSGEKLLCLQNRDGGGGATACASDDDLVTGDGFMWLTETDLARDTSTSGSISRVAMAMLPRATSVVVVELSDGRTFVQRPIGSAAAFEFENLGDSFAVTVEALDENGDVLTSNTFSGSF